VKRGCAVLRPRSARGKFRGDPRDRHLARRHPDAQAPRRESARGKTTRSGQLEGLERRALRRDNDLILVTNNPTTQQRNDFRELYAGAALYAGLVILIPTPSMPLRTLCLNSRRAAGLNDARASAPRRGADAPWASGFYVNFRQPISPTRRRYGSTWTRASYASHRNLPARALMLPSSSPESLGGTPGAIAVLTCTSSPPFAPRPSISVDPGPLVSIFVAQPFALSQLATIRSPALPTCVSVAIRKFTFPKRGAVDPVVAADPQTPLVACDGGRSPPLCANRKAPRTTGDVRGDLRSAHVMKVAAASAGERAVRSTLSRDEIEQAIRSLATAGWIRLRKVANAYCRGRALDSEELLQEAITRALDGSRTCPAGVDVVRFLAEAMRSIASDTMEALQRQPEFLAEPLIDERGNQLDIPDPPAKCREPACRLARSETHCDGSACPL
jgi:hypothetical protein